MNDKEFSWRDKLDLFLEMSYDIEINHSVNLDEILQDDDVKIAIAEWIISRMSDQAKIIKSKIREDKIILLNKKEMKTLANYFKTLDFIDDENMMRLLARVKNTLDNR